MTVFGGTGLRARLEVLLAGTEARPTDSTHQNYWRKVLAHYGHFAQLGALAFTLVLWCLPTAAWSQGQSAAAIFSLTDAVQSAREHAPAVLLAAAAAASAQSEVGVAGILPNPKITLGTTTDTAAFLGSLYIALPVFGQRETTIHAAAGQARVAAAGTEVASLDAQLAVTLAFTDLWLIAQEQHITAANAARRNRLREAARERFTAGAAPRLELLRAQTEVLRVQAEVAALAEQRLAAAARLSGLLGADFWPPGTSLSDEVFGTVAVPELGAVDVLLDAHPVVRRARALRSAGDAVVTREQRARWPVLGMQVGASLFNRNPPPVNDVSVTVTVELPLFNQPLITRAKMMRAAAQTELDTVRTRLRAQLLGACADYRAADYRYRAQSAEVLPATLEAAELSAEAYRSGKLDLTGAITAEQLLSDTRLTTTRAAADRSRAAALLDHAAGRFR